MINWKSTFILKRGVYEAECESRRTYRGAEVSDDDEGDGQGEAHIQENYA